MKYINFLFLSLVCAVSAQAMKNPDADYLGEQLLEATRENNIKALENLIKNNVDVNYQDGKGRTALMLAATYNRPLCLKALIDAGAHLNQQDNYGFTALMDATGNCFYLSQCLQILIDAGADLNLHCKKGRTALIVAARINNQRRCGSLIQAMLFRNQEQKIASICALLHYLEETQRSQLSNLRNLFAATFRTLAKEARTQVRQEILALENEEIKKNLLTKFNLA